MSLEFRTVAALVFAVTTTVGVCPLANAQSHLEFQESPVNESIRLPFEGADGEPLEATPVWVRSRTDGALEVTPVLNRNPGKALLGRAIILRAGLSTHTLVTLGAGLIIGPVGRGVMTENGSIAGLLLTADAGLRGASVGVGFGATDDNLQAGIGLQADATHFYLGPNSGSTYAGVTGNLGFILADWALGAMTRIAGQDPNASEWLVHFTGRLSINSVTRFKKRRSTR